MKPLVPPLYRQGTPVKKCSENRPWISYMDGEMVEVMVPTCRDGKILDCAIRFRRCWIRRTWEFEVADELIRQAPEAVHAVLGLALMELKKVIING